MFDDLFEWKDDREENNIDVPDEWDTEQFWYASPPDNVWSTDQ